jgi:hypothetical protein
MASVFDYFVGTSQSKFASIAIFSAILVICLAILLSNSDISLGNRIGVVVFVILMSIFPVAISLFELTCIVSGGKNKPYDLCSIYAWVITFMIIFYCFILIVVAIMSMFTYKKALDKIQITEKMNNISKEDANTIAKNIVENESTDPQTINTDTPMTSTASAAPMVPTEPVAPAASAAPAATMVPTEPMVPKKEEQGMYQAQPTMSVQPMQPMQPMKESKSVQNMVSDYEEISQYATVPVDDVAPVHPAIEAFKNRNSGNSEGITGFDKTQQYMPHERYEMQKKSIKPTRKVLPKNKGSDPEPFVNQVSTFASV